MRSEIKQSCEPPNYVIFCNQYLHRSLHTQNRIQIILKGTSRIAGQKHQVCEALCIWQQEKSDGQENPKELQKDLLNNDSVPRFVHCVLSVLYILDVSAFAQSDTFLCCAFVSLVNYLYPVSCMVTPT